MRKFNLFIKKSLIATMLISGLMTLLPSNIFAANYTLNIPYPFPGSMQSTAAVTKTSTARPYVSPSTSSVATNYFISPKPKSSTEATNQITNVTTTGTRYFTYLSGYGGKNVKYHLSAYPTYTEYDPYTVRGTWSP